MDRCPQQITYFYIYYFIYSAQLHDSQTQLSFYVQQLAQSLNTQAFAT